MCVKINILVRAIYIVAWKSTIWHFD